MRTFYVWRLTELGVPIQAIAEAWCVQEDTAARWIERGRNNAEAWLSAREPRVELGSERDGPEPFPASIVAHALTNSASVVRLSERADDLSRARDLAASRGLAGTDDALLAMLFRP